MLDFDLNPKAEKCDGNPISEQDALAAINELHPRGWSVLFAAMVINLCLGCLYAWSVWVKYLTDSDYISPKGRRHLLTQSRRQPQPRCEGSPFDVSMHFYLCSHIEAVRQPRS